MLTSTTPYSRPLGNGLILKSVGNEHDVERVAAFAGQIFGEGVAGLSRSLILHHPHTRPDHWLFVEDENAGQVVSSLVLIPWQWCYEDVTLKSGEVGIVATLEAYRKRGLIRAQFVRHRELLREGEYDLSHIQGIPYFYRQFGYEYAMPLEPGWRVELHNLPDTLPDSAPHYRFRLATLADLPLLMRMYDEAARGLNIRTVRDADIWRYLFEHSAATEMVGETWLVIDETGQPVGYWRIAQHGFGKGLIVSEASRLDHAAVVAVLCQLRTMAVERSKPDIRLNLPATSDLVRAGLCWGAHDLGTYAWQIHVVDVARLLRKLAPVLERRIAASPFAGLSQDVSIDLYREAFDLRFERGRLLTVNAVGFSDKGDIHIPPLLFAPLALGYRSREELTRTYPDVRIWGQSQHLVDVLFPKLESFIFTIY